MRGPAWWCRLAHATRWLDVSAVMREGQVAVAAVTHLECPVCGRLYTFKWKWVTGRSSCHATIDRDGALRRCESMGTHQTHFATWRHQGNPRSAFWG